MDPGLGKISFWDEGEMILPGSKKANLFSRLPHRHVVPATLCKPRSLCSDLGIMSYFFGAKEED